MSRTSRFVRIRRCGARRSSRHFPTTLGKDKESVWAALFGWTLQAGLSHVQGICVVKTTSITLPAKTIDTLYTYSQYKVSIVFMTTENHCKWLALTALTAPTVLLRLLSDLPLRQP